MSLTETIGFHLPEDLVTELINIIEKDGYTVTRNGNQLEARKKPLIKDETNYLTRGQVAKILQISLPTLHDYTKRGLINSYRLGVKVRYKQVDIEAALQQRHFVKKGGSYAA